MKQAFALKLTDTSGIGTTTAASQVIANPLVICLYDFTAEINASLSSRSASVVKVRMDCVTQ